MWIYLLAFGAGAVSEYLSDLWGLRYTHGTATRAFPFDRQRMARHVRRMVVLGWGLLLLGAVDVGAVLGGASVLLAVLAGSSLGGAVATRREMWRRWTRRDTALRGPKPEIDSDEEEE